MWDGSEDLRVLDPAAAIRGVERVGSDALRPFERESAVPDGVELELRSLSPEEVSRLPVAEGFARFEDVFEAADVPLDDERPDALVDAAAGHLAAAAAERRTEAGESGAAANRSSGTLSAADGASESDEAAEASMTPARTGFWPLLWGLLRGQTNRTEREDRKK
jgi:hypothetical protein